MNCHQLACTIALVFVGSLGCAALGNAQEAQQSAPDNSKTNQRDRDNAAATADRRTISAEDRKLTRKFRAAVTADKSLSTYAHNVKIIARDGKVALKGPVRSDHEKTGLLSKATAMAGEENVTDEMDVAPPGILSTVDRCFFAVRKCFRHQTE
jgi:hyperosmotically inducible periplasmic protein